MFILDGIVGYWAFWSAVETSSIGVAFAKVPLALEPGNLDP